VSGILKSKKDIYYYFSVEKQLLLPSYRCCTIGKKFFVLTPIAGFIKDVMARKKSALPVQDVINVVVPRLPEASLSAVIFAQLSVLSLYPKVSTGTQPHPPQFQQHETIKHYLPEETGKSLPDRDFFFKVSLLMQGLTLPGHRDSVVRVAHN
jgi:hypothetical protein